MKRIFTPLLVFCAFSLFAQITVEESIPFERGNCFPPDIRAAELEILKENINILIENGTLVFNKTNQQIGLDWPLHKATGFEDIGYYYQKNFVDANYGMPGSIKDYNCLGETIDEHSGTDIGLWPFAWEKMNNDQVEVIAAADGVITQINDLNPDDNCTYGTQVWNAVFVTHADMSSTIYGNLKSGSLTSKGVGDTVTKGEYLGVVGSSGPSDEPHLHFEVIDDSFNPVDPYNGTCNMATSLWTNQIPYYEPKINAIRTHSTIPGFPACPAEEITNEKNCFFPGERITVYYYYSDEESGMTVTGGIYNSAGTLVTPINRTSSITTRRNFYPATYNIPMGTLDGWWKVELTHEGNTYVHNFTVQEDCSTPLPPLPIQMTYFRGKRDKKENILEWQTSMEINNDFFVLERSRDQDNFEQLAIIDGKGNTSGYMNYRHVDKAPFFGITYYRLRQVDFEGDYSFSKVIAIKNDLGREFQVFPTLVNEEVTINYENDNSLEKVVVYDAAGRALIQVRNFQNPKETTLNLSNFAQGVLFVTIYKKNGTVETQRIFKR